MEFNTRYKYIINTPQGLVGIPKDRIQQIFLIGTLSNFSSEPGYEKIDLILFKIKGYPKTVIKEAKGKILTISREDAIELVKSYLDGDKVSQQEILHALDELDYKIPEIANIIDNKK